METPLVKNSRSAYLAVTMLAGCCVFWGMSFPAMQIGCAELEKAVGGAGEMPMATKLAIRATFNGWRFCLAFAIYYVLTFRRQRGFAPRERWGGMAVGAFYGLGLFLQLLGLRYILPSVSGFLTSLAVIFVPLAQSLLFGRPVSRRTWLAVALAIVGILLLSRPDPHSRIASTLALAPPVPHLGEILTVFSSVLFTGQILALDRYGQGSDAARLTLMLFITTAVVNGAGGAALGAGSIYRAEVFHAIAHSGRFWAAMAGLVLFSSILTIDLMNRFQPLVAPATASVVYCLEPVFATLFSLLLGTERLAVLTAGGGAAVLLAVTLVAVAPQRSLETGAKRN